MEAKISLLEVTSFSTEFSDNAVLFRSDDIR